ncbi:MAG: endonuclease/exonuclease/phosphatase family protein [Microvirga sp.]
MKLITWNIQWGLGMDGRCDLARVVADARRIADFDVLCLQEVSDNFPELRGTRGANQFAELATLLPGCAAIEGVALDIPDGQGRRKRFGNMVLSRYPVGQVLRWTLPWEADHTRNMPRGLIEAVVMAPFGPVRVMTTHLEYSSDKLRRAEAEGIRAAHRSACARVANPREPGPGTYAIQPTAPCAILTGDFNMKPEDPAKLRISAPFETGAPAFVDAWEMLHPDAPHPPSFCLFDQTHGSRHCCDFVFVTQDLQPRVKRVFYDTTTKVSDHQPVLVELDDR